MSNVIIKALEERLRQINEEGFSAAHDDCYTQGQLAAAAACYACFAEDVLQGGKSALDGQPPAFWPWDDAWFKPSRDPKRNIEKAMALLSAQYDAIERAETAAIEATTTPDILWSTNDEMFNHDDLQELIEERQLQAGDTVYFGTKRHAKATDFTTNIDELVIEGMQVQAEDDAGEVAEDYPSASEPQIQVLQTLIEAWATTYCAPVFYQVLNTQPYTLTASDIREVCQ
ncbi:MULTISPECIES: hypothetical protein [unclassified Halomonas]|uniref:hypothetical protein n=1 Tax=unclassified Halomonas TaxID=2609666 RepID=UPI0007D92B79|nr:MULTISPECIES: hypothetical protein [unclassified Halomonas]MBT2788084.1 hypothetical protein [Halomonas sp. ISL-106]MBT2795833.1 hypothetical protein [Halomonas sp. ISL-104]OAL61116.1 hypothetical protein A6R74_16090 [Halomonas sp. ALS9]